MKLKQIATDGLDSLDLRQLAKGFLGWKKFRLQKTVTSMYASRTYSFDLLLSPEGQLVALLLKDYRRTCGVNVIQNFSHLLEILHPQIQRAIVVSNQFSLAARAIVEELDVELQLLPRGELVSTYRNNQIRIPTENENWLSPECSRP